LPGASDDQSRLDTASANGGSNRLHHRPGKLGRTRAIIPARSQIEGLGIRVNRRQLLVIGAAASIIVVRMAEIGRQGVIRHAAAQNRLTA